MGVEAGRLERAALAGTIRTVAFGRPALELVRSAARGEWRVVLGAYEEPPSSYQVERGDVLQVVSPEWLRSVDGLEFALRDWCGLVLIDSSADAEIAHAVRRAAPSASMAVVGGARAGEAIASTLRRIRVERAAAGILAHLSPATNCIATELLRVALRLDPQSATAKMLAGALHLQERTLRKRLVAQGSSATPRQLLGWARLLHAAWWLRDPDRTIEWVADDVGVSAPPNLYRLCWSYAGLRLRDLRATTDPDMLTMLVQSCQQFLMRTVATRGWHESSAG